MHKKRGLRMMVVSLLSSSPKNGVEIMDGIEAMTRGWWRPSPGSVYPLLGRMVEEGTVKQRSDGRYELTPKANAELEVSFGRRFRRPQTVDDMMTEMHGFVSYMEDLDSSGSKALEPHVDKLKGLSKRLSDLIDKREPKSETSD
jgi:DNA-binding PadR family transcriptional regulator